MPYIGGCSMLTPDLTAKLGAFDTPFYFYDLSLLQLTLERLTEAALPNGYHVHYALKANNDRRILSLISSQGLGADCVSGNEISRALEAGFAREKIVFAGVGKTDREIRLALKTGILCFNCESLQEIEVINGLAGEIGVQAPLALRVNPQVDAKTHHYITTGLAENKFGINLEDLDTALGAVEKYGNVKLIGLHFHIGSQITSMRVFRSLCVKVNEIQRRLRDRRVDLPNINLGGGLGVDYRRPRQNPIPDFQEYFGIFNRFLEVAPGQSVHFELGRALVAQCGTLITRVLYVKNGLRTRFAIVDAGMTELIRPALYQSYHKIVNLTGKGPQEKYDVVGPVCESADCFGKAVALTTVRRGDLLAIHSAGAYGEVMSSAYNLRDRAPVIYSDRI